MKFSGKVLGVFLKEEKECGGYQKRRSITISKPDDPLPEYGTQGRLSVFPGWKSQSEDESEHTPEKSWNSFSPRIQRERGRKS